MDITDPQPHPPVPRPKRLRSLPLAAGGAWFSAVFLVLLLWAQWRSAAMHPAVAPILALLLTLTVSTLFLLGTGLWRLARGPARLRVSAWLLLGVVPVLAIGIPVEKARRGWAHREAPGGIVTRLVAFGGVALMETDARLFYPHRVETQRLVMFHAGVATPDADAAAMERHVAALEGEVGRPLRARIYWVRGTTFGQGGMATFGLCLGSGRSPRSDDPDDPARVLDHHELAHAVMNQHERPGADVPSFLNEGWAECHSYADPARLTGLRVEAQGRRARGEWVALRDLAGPRWYHRHRGPVYFQGHLWAEFLLRRFGVDRFIELCNTARPETFDADCRRVYGAGVDELEGMLWRDIESATFSARPRPSL